MTNDSRHDIDVIESRDAADDQQVDTPAPLNTYSHQFGRTVIPSAQASSRTATIPSISAEDSRERRARSAFERRLQPDFQKFENRQPDEGQSWSTQFPGCEGADDGDDDLAETGRTTIVHQRAAETLEKPERLLNKTAVALVIVDGPGPEFKISDAERENIESQWQEATEWISAQRPTAKISWYTEVHDASVDITPWEGAPWKGMPNYDGVSAMFTNSANGKIYGFDISVGANSSTPRPQYFRISSVANGVDAGYPKDIKDHWDLPAQFDSGVDAACWREKNEKIYLFKGSKYVRVDPETFAADQGYPKQIAEGWKNIDPEFAKGVDAVLGHKGNNSIYMFKGDQYIKFTNGSSTMAAGYPKPIADHWGGENLGNFAKGIDCAFWRDSTSTIYLFRNSRFGGKYLQIDPDTFTVKEKYKEGVPIGLSKEDAEALWRNPALEQLGVEGSMAGAEQLALNAKAAGGAQNAIIAFVTKWTAVHSGYASGHRFTLSKSSLAGNFFRTMAHETLHLFGAKDEYKTTSSCSKEYGRFFKAKNTNSRSCTPSPVPCIMDANEPAVCAYTELHVGWGPFEEKVDATVFRGDTGKTYLFGGAHYIRYSDIADIKEGRDKGYPRYIASGFSGLPIGFKLGIDTALWREDNEALYFFKGDEYVRFDKGSNTVKSGYPRKIKNHWKGLPVEFQSDLDAAFWRKSNDRIYLFKGNKYVRMEVTASGITMESEYPKSIATHWDGLTGVDAVLMRRDTNQIYFFHGTRYTRFSKVSDGKDAGYPKFIDRTWMPFPR
ncbi:hemopexin repeat-containing protein [uncultured Roseovarius sp.]|uniref:hemopexin repeat-containing protein n=1 Tax=uncultured Roseovarius sp. TaxID=293344 RepID=UPI0026154F7A|nr:hemopexin repeat-containing protein [uncultured Roseovarius sp.]